MGRSSVLAALQNGQYSRLTVLVVLGVALIVGPSLVSAVVAPAVGIQRPDAGEVVVSYEGRPDGRVSWYGEDGRTVWSNASARSYLAVQAVSNRTVFTTWKRIQQTDCGQFEAPCAHTGFSMLNRNTGEVRRQWHIPVAWGGNSEVHDAELLPNGNVLVADMDRERILLLSRENEVLWQWNASEFYERPPEPLDRDWLHINDVDRIGEGRYLISVRNANQLLVLERGEGVVEVINEQYEGSHAVCTRRAGLYDHDGDGEVQCGDPGVMWGQHNPHWLNESTILVADSRNNRIVELRKADNGTWTVGWTVRRANDIALDWPRDADRLPNGNTVITDSRNNRVVTVAPNGSVVWSQATPGLPYEADLLPYGEQSANVSANPSLRVGTGSAVGAIPLLSTARNGLTHVAPVPYWFTDLHLLGIVLGLGCLLAAGVIRGRRALSRRLA
jgi:hypothetical protein